MAYSEKARRNLLATSAEAGIVVCLEITHPDLEVPVRVINDVQNLTSVANENGVASQIEFIACPFDITLPDDIGEQVPKAQLSVDNIGRELTQWLEYSNGGAGAKCRILIGMRDDLDCLVSDFGPYATDYFAQDHTEGIDISEWSPWEYDMTLDMSGMSITNEAVSAELGFQNTLNQPAVAVRYDPTTSPGMW